MKFSSTATTRVAATALMGMTALSLAACGDDESGNSDAGGGKDVRVAYIGARSVPYQQAGFAGLDSVEGIDAKFIDVGFDVAK